MEDYRLEQSGQEVQDILNGAAMQTDLTAENERAELAEQTLQGNIDAEALARENADGVLQGHIDDEETRAKAAEKQNADDIDAIEEKIPTQASSSNQLADKDYVEDLVSTSSATFRGTFNLVSDLHLTVDASYADIAAALGNAIAGADNNDFAFVMIPTSVDTPNEIARIEKYKFNGSVWGFEYMLNNSGFTAAQWAAINSGITSALVTKLGALPSAADLAAALLAKQDKLTFDQAPTPSSTNPVTSGGVYTAIDDEKGARVNADAALQQAIEAILVLIPSAATALNQLADKAFVNSSIATATATFRGTFNLVSDLQLTVDATHADIAAALLNAISSADNNDYAFVQIPTSVDTPTEIRVTERYKFNGTAWQYEYDLNNSGFTAAQWAAINSGITTLLVTKLSNLPNATELATLFAGKQNVLTFDNAPVSGSDNPVKSGGLYDLFAAIDAKMPTGASANNKLVAEDRLAAYVGGIIGALDATFDLTSTDGHVTLRMTQTDGVIASLQILTSDIASASALATLGGQVSTNADDIAALQALYNALQQSAPQIIEPTDTWPVASPSDTVIYRVVDRVNTPPQYYSDYMWNGTAMVLMATYNNAIDPRPKKASQNLVTSGGVFDNMGALDVSELNATENPHALAQYVDLSAALAAVPIDYQKGGMSIKFVQSSDNNYIRYNLLADSFTTDTTQWAIDDVGVYIDNPEFIEVKTNSQGQVLSARDNDGRLKELVGIDTNDLNSKSASLESANIGILKLSEGGIDSLIDDLEEHGISEDSITQEELELKLSEYSKTTVSDNRYAFKSLESEVNTLSDELSSINNTITDIERDVDTINAALSDLTSPLPSGAITGDNVWTGANQFTQAITGVSGTNDNNIALYGQFKNTLNRFVDAADYGFDTSNNGVNNALALNTALAGGNKTVVISKPGIYLIGNTILVEDNTTIICSKGVVLKKASSDFCNVILNKGAETRTFNTNITLIGVHISLNNMEALNPITSPLYGMRGVVGFICVKNLLIDQLIITDLAYSQYAIHINSFEHITICNSRIAGEKDGIHLSDGKYFVVRNCQIDTYDDVVAMNSSDWDSSNCVDGSLRYGLIECCSFNYLGRLFMLVGALVDWFDGMEIVRGDRVVSNGKVYRAVGIPPTSDNNKYYSHTRPTITTYSGVQSDSGGFSWKLVKDTAFYQTNVENITIRNCYSHNTPLSVRVDIPSEGEILYNRSIYPTVPDTNYPKVSCSMQDCVFDSKCFDTYAQVNVDLALENVKLGSTPLYVTTTASNNVHAKVLFKDCDYSGLLNEDYHLSPGYHTHVIIDGAKGVEYIKFFESQPRGRVESNYPCDISIFMDQKKGDIVKGIDGTTKIYNGTSWNDLTN